MTVPFAEQEFQIWRHHPVSKVFLQYIKDYAAALERDALERWKQGALTLSLEQEARGRILTCLEVADLPYESIREFYDGERAEDK